MRDYTKFYIDGAWVEPAGQETLDVINPATEEVAGRIALGSLSDVDRAVAAAHAAFPAFSETSREERLALFDKIIAAYKARYADVAAAITEEMGAPTWLAEKAQASIGLGHVTTMRKILENFVFEDLRGTTLIRREPVGVCGFITPWNWPMNQMMCKIAPALAAGCTMVLKPSEVAPFSAQILAEIMDEAGVPKGVFNLVYGDGPTVGQALSSHKDIDMVSFTGSTRAGIAVAQAAAPTVKRVAQELGGKSPNIILADADLESAVKGGVLNCFSNAGQSCNAPSRMLVPMDRHDEAAEIAKAVAEKAKVGNPLDPDTKIGPIAYEAQYQKIQGLIEQGIAEGARLMTGGPGRPAGLNKGYFVRPTVFADVNNDMIIAREEVFGPVLTILPYKDEEEAVRIANDTVYGLSAYVQSGDLEHAKSVARKIRAGNVHINGAGPDLEAPFGGYKMSGNGREWGEFGLHDFLEVKAVMGAA